MIWKSNSFNEKSIKLIEHQSIFIENELDFNTRNQQYQPTEYSKLVKYNGKIEFDHKSPDGTYRKGLNSSKIKDLGWYPRIKLEDGLKKVIEKRF